MIGWYALLATIEILVVIRYAGWLFRQYRSFDRRGVVFLGITLAACAAFWISPRNAAELRVSDAAEYVSSALIMLQQGVYGIPLDGGVLPSRFQPWFSLLIVAPVLAIFSVCGGTLDGASMGVPALAIVLCAVLTTLTIGALAGRWAGRWGACISALLFLVAPGVRYFAQQALVDIPIALAAVVLCALYMRAIEAPSLLRNYLYAGIVIGAAFLLRPTALLLGLPWIVLMARSRNASAIASFVLPLVICAALYCGYQKLTFGSFARSGYQYWLSVPYDYPGLVFNMRYVGTNLALITQESGLVLLWMGVAAALVWGKRLVDEAQVNHSSSAYLHRSPITALNRVVVFSSIGLLAPHLCYFYATPRFFLPLVAIATISCGVVGGLLVSRMRHPVRCAWGCAIALLMVASIALNALARGETPLRTTAEKLATRTPQNALIVTAINPVYLYPWLANNSERTIVPVSRRVEFASKVIMASTPVDRSAPTDDPFEHRAALERGAREAVQRTAIDDSEWLFSQIAAGRPAYLDLTSINQAEWEAIKERFSLGSIEGEMVQMLGRPAS